MVNEFEAGGKKFKLSKINAMIQFHIVRRIGPVLGELFPALGLAKGMKIEGMNEGQKFDEFAKLLTPVMNGFSKLSDADSEFVLNQLLSSVEVHQPQFNHWAKVANKESILMQDLELPTLLHAAGMALMFNLEGFFSITRPK